MNSFQSKVNTSHIRSELILPERKKACNSSLIQEEKLCLLSVGERMQFGTAVTFVNFNILMYKQTNYELFPQKKSSITQTCGTTWLCPCCKRKDEINLKPIRERFDAPSSSQEAPKISFGGPDSCPRPARNRPRRSQDRLKRSQEGAWRFLNASNLGFGPPITPPRNLFRYPNAFRFTF